MLNLSAKRETMTKNWADPEAKAEAERYEFQAVLLF